ncbi:MAG: metallophosphoesterase family protein [Candidatus Zixiibacteriota bacterium]|nr:MAG: metallophosphoesterase family protein [candidate division Zixibacteria bacterium]
MKVALISDVHGNLEALESTLRDIERQGAEKIHFLGDALGYGCNPNECVRLIDKHCEIKLLGNHDYAAMGLESTEHFNQLAQASMDWTMAQIKNKTVRIMADFELEAVFLDYYLVHSSPTDPDKWRYILNPEQAVHHFDNFTQSVCFIGHSHYPTYFELDPEGWIAQRIKNVIECVEDRKYIINIGSVGQPRDNDPRACYVIVNTEKNEIEYRRVEYDVEKTQEKMRKAKLPDFLIERLTIGV